MNLTRRSLTTLAAGLVVLGGVGCSAAKEKASEKLTEKAIEEAAGGSADVDIDGGNVQISTPDGNYTADENGNVQIETPDGSYSAGTGELPDGWPKEIPLPDDLEVVTGSSIDGGDQTMLSVIGTTGLEPDEAVALVTDALSDWENEGEYDMSGGGTTTKSVQLRDGERSLSLTAGRNDGEDVTNISYGLTIDAGSEG